MFDTTPDVLFIATRDFGGAGIATLRLLKAVNDAGVTARMLTRLKRSGKPEIALLANNDLPVIENLWMRAAIRLEDARSQRIYNKHRKTFSYNLIPHAIHKQINYLKPQLVHLHWIGGVLPLRSFPRIDAPLIWTLHDNWAYTGGCHINGDCLRYLTGCGQCPILGATHLNDASRKIYQQKEIYLQNLSVEIIVPSKDMATRVKASPLLADKPIHVIPNVIDTSTFKPLNTAFAREALGFPPDKKLILFVSQDLNNPNKGGDLLVQALHTINTTDDVTLVVVGDGNLGVLGDLPVPVIRQRAIYDNRLLNLMYAACDVCVVPSRQESFGMVAAESLASGTPCVVFDVGGLTDIVDHKENGYIAERFDPQDFASGVDWILSYPDKNKLSLAGIDKVRNTFAQEVVASQQIDIYNQLLKD